MARKRLAIGGVCLHGHELTGDTIFWREARGVKYVACLLCTRVSKNKSAKKAIASKGAKVITDEQKVRYLANARRARLVRRVDEVEDSITKKDLLDDRKVTAPWNYLKPTGAVQEALDVLDAGITESGANCLNRPAEFVDFDDPRFPDEVDPSDLRPLPSAGYFRAVCAGCPVFALCGSVGKTGDPVTLDFGPRAGVFYVGGKAYGHPAINEKKED